MRIQSATTFTLFTALANNESVSRKDLVKDLSKEQMNSLSVLLNKFKKQGLILTESRGSYSLAEAHREEVEAALQAYSNRETEPETTSEETSEEQEIVSETGEEVTEE